MFPPHDDRVPPAPCPPTATLTPSPMLAGSRSRLAASFALPALLLAGGLVAFAPAPPRVESAGLQDRPVTAIVVRHAERATTHPTDPPLDSIGNVRAVALREALRDAGVSAVYVTQYRRTRETAAPLTEALGLEPREIRAGRDVEEHAAEIARTLLANHRGETVLVVGHSNTIGRIVRALGADAPAELEDHEYEHLYIVSADGESEARFVRARFGPPNPAPRETRLMR